MQKIVILRAAHIPKWEVIASPTYATYTLNETMVKELRDNILHTCVDLFKETDLVLQILMKAPKNEEFVSIKHTRYPEQDK